MKRLISFLLVTIISAVMLQASFAATLVGRQVAGPWAFPNGLYAVSRNNPPAIFIAPAAASATSLKNAVSVSSTSLTPGTSVFTLANGDYADVIYPRNLTFALSYVAGTASTTASCAFVIQGKDQFGVSQTETVIASTNSVVGSVAWATVTSITAGSYSSNTGESAVKISIGTGLKLGLPVQLVDSTDIVKVIENNAVSTTYVIDYTKDTITFAAAPDGSKNYSVWTNAGQR